MLDLFTAGTETTSSTLSWGMLFMILNPRVQTKVHAELDEVLRGEEVSMSDRSRLVQNTSDKTQDVID